MSVKQICWVVALVWACLIIVKATLHYHLLTAGDDFQGYIQFNLNLELGKLREWWQMWDADIPLVSRVLYWIDFRLNTNLQLQNEIAFVFAINIATLWAIVFVWFLYLRQLGIAEFTPVAVLLTFNWEQITNLQQPFCGAAWFPNVLFPLIAFYCLSTNRFKTALGSGVLSVGTMANGLLVLPLMAAMAWMIGVRWNKIALIVGIWLVIGGAYYFVWVSYPATGIAAMDPMTWNWNTIRPFALTYLGGPAFHILEYWGPEYKPEALIVGEIIVFLTAGFVIGWDHNKTEMALLCFLMFVIGTATMAGIARSGHYGTLYAAAPRYGMDQLAGWQAMGAMLFVRIRPQLRPLFLGLAVAIIGLLFLPVQVYFEG